MRTFRSVQRPIRSREVAMRRARLSVSLSLISLVAIADHAFAGGGLLGIDHEFWQSIDSSLSSAVAAELLKYAFSRARPRENLGPDKWFQGGCCQSFPGGEGTLQAGFVTPIILDESARGHPWIWALEVLPLYDGIGRLKQQAHWQSDVLAGWALGTASGYWAAHRDTSLSVQILPGGFSVGLQKRF